MSEYIANYTVHFRGQEDQAFVHYPEHRFSENSDDEAKTKAGYHLKTFNERYTKLLSCSLDKLVKLTEIKI